MTSRDHVNVRLREVLDEASEKWSVKVTRVEIREIDPPKSIQDSMALQMQAERERRAQVTNAEGQKQAAILKAKGEKAAKLLSAEGDRDAQIARAEGDRQSEILRASGNAQAIATQFKAINEAGVSPQILALKYIEALQSIAGQGASKVFIPYEATGLLGARARWARRADMRWPSPINRCSPRRERRTRRWIREGKDGRAAEAQRMLDKLIARFGHAAAFQIAEAYAWFAQQMKTGCSDIRCPSPPPADRSSFENLP